MHPHPGEIPIERALAIGIDPEVSGLRSVLWTDLTSELNVADYQLVIIHLPSVSRLNEDGRRRALDILTRDRISRLLEGPNTELIVIDVFEDDLGWFLHSLLPTPLSAERETGNHITDLHPEFVSYLDLVDEYRWITGDPSHETASYEPLAKAARRDVVSMAVWWRHRAANLIWLPTARDTGLALRALLESRYGFRTGSLAPPSWAKDINLPSMVPLTEALTQIEVSVTELTRKRDQVAHRLEEEARPISLLYETGLELERVVREVLTTLGGEVADPAEDDDDDGTVTSPAGERLVLEIKGRTGVIRVADVRQLDDWVTQRSYPDDDSAPEEWKGLLVANALRETRPDQRRDEFGPNALRLAQEKGLALITTRQLFSALAMHQQDEFDPEAWWGAIMTARGMAGGSNPAAAR